MLESDRMQAILFQAKEYWVHSDVERFSDLFVAEGEFIREGHHCKGREAIHSAFSELLNQFVIKHIDIQDVRINGNTAVMEWAWETFDKDSGDRLQKKEAIAIDFAEDGIQRWREHTDAEQSIDPDPSPQAEVYEDV